MDRDGRSTHPHSHPTSARPSAAWPAASSHAAPAASAAASLREEDPNSPVGRSRKRKGNSKQVQQPYPEPHAMNMQAATAAAAASSYAPYGALPPGRAAHPHAAEDHLAQWQRQHMAAAATAAASIEPPSASQAASVHPLSFAGAASVAPAAQTFSEACLTLGIETADDSMCPVIPRGTKLPCTSAQLFSTYADQQPGVSILVYQGQRASTRDNQFLGRLDLLGIRPAPRGVPRIEVTFTLDVYGSLRVTAHESLHGTVQALTVQEQFDAPAKHWRPEIVDAVLKDAEMHRTQDEQMIARIAAKSRLEQFTYGLRTSLEQHTWRSMLTADEAQIIRQQHERTVQWLGERENRSVQPEEYEAKLEEIQTVCQPIVMKMYTVAIAGQAPALTSQPSESVMANVMQPQPPMQQPQPQPQPQPQQQHRNSAETALAVPTARGVPVFSSPTGFSDGHRTPPPPVQSGTYASPEAYRYPSSHAPLASLSASNSSPFHSSMTPPTSSNWHVPHWTHPSLLTSPILSSTNHHLHHSNDWTNGGANGGPGVGNTNQAHSASAVAPGGLASNMEEAYMDFLTFPNSATLSLTHVTLSDTETAALTSRPSDTRLLAPHDLDSSLSASAMPSGSAAHLMRQPLPEPLRSNSMFHEQSHMRLRGGGGFDPALDETQQLQQEQAYSSNSAPPPQR